MSESSHRKRPRAMTRTTSKGEITHEVQTENHDESRRAKISSDASTCIESKSIKEDGEKVGELSQPLDFLHSCGACGRPLGLERDIYIYRGESAFCSAECRERHMRYDLTKRNSSLHQRE
ncbi:uncharacterized protein LOC109719572 [Ananas comosus]|uniref:Uncharacterized protein LOC109719572 n=2 Tax=Ananas comosus TaxID=4615 RepID=A0A6P5G0N5_ANACO|nr:uncharacterized protein LOC109719572 [Ananas comosus]